MNRPRLSDPAATLQEAGQRAWALLGVLLVLWAASVVLSEVSVVLVGAGLALFPAALLSPVAEGLRRRGVPGALIALLLILGTAVGLALVLLLIVPRFVDEVPELAGSLQQALLQVRDVVDDADLPVDVPDLDQVGERIVDAFDDADGVVGQGIGVVVGLVHLVTGLLLALVTLFFVLKDGRRIWKGLLDLVPERARDDVDLVARQAWWTLGAYLRGQLLVAAFDAVFIGLGLLLLGVPLAVPLAVLVLFGGLFPIVGAFASGLVAVLVALADGGPLLALAVLALVLVVQQVEGNVLEPLILSKVIALHPLAIILAVSAGGLAFGILGAFLAVPLWAIAARVVDHLRGRRPPSGPASEVVPSEP